VEYLVEFRGNFFGIATLSRYPIVEKGVVPFDREGTNMCIYTDIDYNGKIVRVYNMHLQSLHFKQTDLEFLKSLNFSDEQTLAGAKNIFSRFKHAFIRREEQAKTIREHINDCPYPVVLCGDFNDTPLSYSYELLKGDLIDAFQEKGTGIGSTYNGAFPLLRIDYVLHSANLQLHYFEKKKEDLSDHYPLVAYFTFDEAE
jgi:endonuclease/exonuclease/phosphatase family metal-dependent hydrolase